jgi:hypothetical protein
MGTDFVMCGMRHNLDAFGYCMFWKLPQPIDQLFGHFVLITVKSNYYYSNIKIDDQN